jgi:group I intron endonuclease
MGCDGFDPVAEKTMATGVYCIECLADGKSYVGSASKSLTKRLWTHRSLLSKGRHTNLHLQAAWDKYGKESFRFSVLEQCLPSECLVKEQGWIDQLDACNKEKGFNKAPVAGSTLGVKHTIETRNKVSAALKGKKKTEEHAAAIKKGKQVISQRTRQKLSDRAQNRTAEHQAKLSNNHVAQFKRSYSLRKAWIRRKAELDTRKRGPTDE